MAKKKKKVITRVIKEKKGIVSTTPAGNKRKPATRKKKEKEEEKGIMAVKKGRVVKGEKKGDSKREITALCRELGPALIEKLKEVALSDTKRRLPTKIHAIEVLLDRGYGKPKETVDTGVTIVWDMGPRRKDKVIDAPVDVPALEDKGNG